MLDIIENRIELRDRQAVVAEAMTWIGTPFHFKAKIKGVGCDCLTLITESFGQCGVIVNPDLPDYQGQWHLHRSEELYIVGLERYCKQIDEPMPADIALFHCGRTYSHAAIVTLWPMIVHSVSLTGAVLTDAVRDGRLKREYGNFPIKFYSPWR